MLIEDLFQKYPHVVPQKGVLHVGACVCEEQEIYEAVGMSKENVLWLEANEDLVRAQQAHQPNLLHAVVDEHDDRIETLMITNNNSASSSLLNFKTHRDEYPHIYEIERRTVKTISLNTLFNQHNIPYDRYDFMNLDIQGLELRALRGATMLLPHIKAIYTEVNEKELYENCAMLHEIDEFLTNYDFKRETTFITKHGWGDALYVKTKN